MIITYRVNSELMGILHLNSNEPKNAHIDAEFMDDKVRCVFSVHRVVDEVWGFLEKRGFKKGDPIKIEVDDETGEPIRVVWE